jgi:hypothetical protein
MSLSTSSGRVSYAPSTSAPNPNAQPANTGTFIAKINNVTLGQMGLVGGLAPGNTVADLKNIERFAIKAGVYEALRAQVATSIEGLSSRQIIPKRDFRDVNNNQIKTSEWRQPWSGGYTFFETSGGYTVYQTNTQSDYDKKVFTIYGVRLVNNGNARTSGAVNAALLELSDSVNNVYDLWQLQGLDTANVLYAYSPIVYSTNKAMKLNVYCKSTASGSFDTIEIIGKVIERIGDNVMGTRFSQFE